MYPLISTWFIAPGKEAKVIPALKKLAVNVKKNEPDTLVYLVHTPDMTQTNLPTPPANQVVFFEIYKDEAAFKAHIDGADFKNFVANYGKMFVSSNGSPYVTALMLQHEAGYIRAAMG